MADVGKVLLGLALLALLPAGAYVTGAMVGPPPGPTPFPSTAETASVDATGGPVRTGRSRPTSQVTVTGAADASPRAGDPAGRQSPSGHTRTAKDAAVEKRPTSPRDRGKRDHGAARTSKPGRPVGPLGPTPTAGPPTRGTGSSDDGARTTPVAATADAEQEKGAKKTRPTKARGRTR
jgi:hypothetical protein